MTLTSAASVQTPLAQVLQRLRNCSQVSIQSQWRGCLADLSPAAALGDAATWEITQLNQRQHISWARGHRVLWLRQRIVVPAVLDGYPLEALTLRLALTWWAEDAQIFVDQKPVQSGDLFDCFTRLCLSEAVQPGETFELALRLVSPGHDDGALVRSQLIYEAPPDWCSPEPGFVADELAVVQHYVMALAPERLEEIEQATAQIDWQVLEQRQAFHRSLMAVRQTLAPLGNWIKQRQVACVGHAHLDMAWLWPVAETWQAAERTFESVLALQQDYPELTYSHSSPALFAWLEAHRPELFTRIQQQVAAGRWTIDAGLWIEPELNLVGGEAIARHILYAQRYSQAKFGSISTIAWLPDTFGFCHQLPQLLHQGGIAVFATQKLRWNDTTAFPHELFTWAAPDGSEVLGWTLPPIGTDFDPVQIAEYAAQWEAKTGVSVACWLPGMGDHGGGPTRDMLDKARRWAESPLFPQVNFTTPHRFIAQAAEQVGAQPLPRWDDELYLELHRGCYTTHADQKWHNRRCEDLLYEAELWSAIAALTAQQGYPKAELEQAWKKVLFNQFHDILPGTAIPQVFEDANRDWVAVRQSTAALKDQALRVLANAIAYPPPPCPTARPLVVFNPLSWERTETARVTLDADKSFTREAAHWQVCDLSGQTVPTQVEPTQPGAATGLTFLATVPAVGYQRYWLCPATPASGIPQSAAAEQLPTGYCLENVFLRAVIDAVSGDITSLYSHVCGQEILSGAANQLQTFADDGQYWDAWNIAPDYERHPLPAAPVVSVEWLARGPVTQQLRVRRQLGQSMVDQIYRLDADSPILAIETDIDWQETQTLLKVNFPIGFSTDTAIYEAPFGAIARSTHARPPGTTQPSPIAENYAAQHARTKWEVPALRWADLSTPDGSYGLSILTDSKHGFDAAPQQLRLTLLKSPLWPDPSADRGPHRFTYALYPHAGSWQQAHTGQQAQALNLPLQGRVSDAVQTGLGGDRSFLSLKNAHLAALKQSEDDPSSYILRCYDAEGSGLAPELTHTLGVAIAEETNLLEQPPNQPLDQTVTSPTAPYRIRTYRLA